MNDSCFFDTNVLIYAHSDLDPVKQRQAEDWIQTTAAAFVSTQVIQEFANAFLSKFKLDLPTVQNLVSEVGNNFIVLANTYPTITHALHLKERYQFSFWDSLIIAAALEAGCATLFSEDLQDGQIIDNSLQIINPFKTT